MPFSRLFAVFVAATILSVLPPAVCAQKADLPSAPGSAAPEKPVFRLPPGTPVPVASSHGAPPPAPDEEIDDCFAAAEGIYAKQKPFSAAVQAQVDHYKFEMLHQIEVEWLRHMPFSTKDPWLKNQTLAVRFAIMPDGSINTPTVTIFSGRPNYDKHAVDSIIASAPFAPLPAGVNRPLPMCFHFIYSHDQFQTPKKAKPLDLWPGPAKPDAKDGAPAGASSPQ